MSNRPNSSSTDLTVADAKEQKQPTLVRWIMIAAAALVGVIVVSLLIAIIGAATGSEGVGTAFRVVRDFLIIVLALQGILVSVALVVLVVQLSALVNLLRNEVSPLIDEARYTLVTLRGTSEFVSKNVTSPVIRIASSVAGARAFISELVGIQRNVNGANSRVKRAAQAAQDDHKGR